jgi:hypothetical protein
MRRQPRLFYGFPDRVPTVGADVVIERPLFLPYSGVMRKTLLILAGAVCCAAASPQIADEAKSRPGIFGRVTNSETHDAVRRADVKVFNGPDQWDETTDGEGRFRFPDLAPGQYNLVAHRDGYSDHAYIVEKSDFIEQKELPVVLRPQGLITGKAVDAFGQPLRAVGIEALGSRTRGGKIEVINSARTNDLGEYRLSGLDPASYQIRATYREGRSSELDPTPLTMATSYYGNPGTPAQIAVKTGSMTSGIDFMLRPVRPATVRGVLRTETGPLSEPATLWIMGREGEGGHNGSGRDGKFEIEDVGPGTDTISAETLNKAAPVFGLATVEVHGDDVDAVDILLQPVPKIDVEIRVEGGGPPDLEPGAIYFMATERVRALGMEIGHPNKDGKFTTRLIPGEYSLSFDAAYTGRGVRQVTLNDRPVSNWKFQMDGSADAKKLVIVVGARPRQ